MWDWFKKIYYLKDLRRKMVYALSLLIVFRFLAHIPLPGVDLARLKYFFTNNEAFGMLNLFTGGAMENFSLVMMGVGPYITSSIIFQLLVIIVPSLEALSKEGEYGKNRINYYTRMATVPLAIVQSYAMIFILKSQGIIGSLQPMELTTMLVSLTAGTVLLMWLGELISENGIGNGVSLIISLGIIASLPTSIAQTLTAASTEKVIGMLIFAALALLVVAAIVFINQGERQIPVTYARMVRGMRSLGAVDTHLPLRVAMAGVIPIIFALSMMIFPTVIAKFFIMAKSVWLANAANWVYSHFQTQNLEYSIIYFVMVIAFTFFYTSVIFNPKQVAENLQKRGGFVPGLRPGKETADYLSNVLRKITLIGAIFLAFIAILPFVIQSITHLTTLVLGGTGVLIVVSVVLDTMRQIKAQLIMRQYDHY